MMMLQISRIKQDGVETYYSPPLTCSHKILAVGLQAGALKKQWAFFITSFNLRWVGMLVRCSSRKEQVSSMDRRVGVFVRHCSLLQSGWNR